jgi:hypothetical protein
MLDYRIWTGPNAIKLSTGESFPCLTRGCRHFIQSSRWTSDGRNRWAPPKTGRCAGKK